MYRFNEMHNIEKIFNFIPFPILLIYIWILLFMIIFRKVQREICRLYRLLLICYYSLASWNGIYVGLYFESKEK